MDIRQQLKELITTLERYDPGDLPPWQIGSTFNVLLAEAKKAAPEDSIVQSFSEVQSGPGDIYADTNANGLAGMARQLHSALAE